MNSGYDGPITPHDDYVRGLVDLQAQVRELRRTVADLKRAVAALLATGKEENH